MKKLISLFVIIASLGFAQIAVPGAAPVVPPSDPAVIGTMTIDFGSISSADSKGKPAVGAVDLYTINVNVANSVIFKGTIVHTPNIPGSIYGTKQEASLVFDMNTIIVNQKNPKQTMNIGNFSGHVPIDKNNIYHFSDGDLAIETRAVGRVGAIDSKCIGTAIGKPPVKESLGAAIKKAAVSISRNINGKTTTIVVADYDKLDFSGLILPAGPLSTYPEVLVTGSMIFDFKRNSWHFLNLTCSYSVNGQTHNDVIGGDMDWLKPDSYETDGLNSYNFAIKINEPPPSTDAMFSPSTDDSDVFAVDNSTPGLSGTISYQDVFFGNPKDEKVSSTSAKINLVGNKLTAVQTMYLTKLILFIASTPMND